MSEDKRAKRSIAVGQLLQLYGIKGKSGPKNKLGQEMVRLAAGQGRGNTVLIDPSRNTLTTSLSPSP